MNKQPYFVRDAIYLLDLANRLKSTIEDETAVSSAADDADYLISQIDSLLSDLNDLAESIADAVSELEDGAEDTKDPDAYYSMIAIARSLKRAL